jgi:pyridoxal phosphate enzyme (YggS family)
MDTPLAHNLRVVRERIARAAEASGRTAEAITLVAVTKTHPVAVITAARALGLVHLGENRVQEAEDKFAAPGAGAAGVVARPGLILHLIGTLQRNKARRAATFFDAIDSVDRIDLVEALERVRAGAGGPPLPVLIEVNVSGEASKSGVAPADLDRLAGAVRAAAHLAPRGLMTIAPFEATDAELRRVFARLRALRDGLAAHDPQAGWTALSMGMSGDYEAAIREGATEVRLGTALFGPRSQEGGRRNAE